MLNDEHASALASLQNLKPKNAKKLHWRELNPRAQRKSLEIISDLDAASIIILGAPLINTKQERARRKCLEALLAVLENKGVGKLVLESRDGSLDKRDIDLLLSSRRSKKIKTIDLHHAPGAGEPRLYIPDQILGAFGDIRTNGDNVKKWEDKWHDLEKKISVVEVPVH